MKRMNLNQLAKRVAEREGGKQNLSIAQIKEVIRIALEEVTENEDAIECRSAVVFRNINGRTDIYQL